MRACFLLPTLSRSGGVDVLAGHAARLRADHGWDVELVSIEDRAALDRALAEEWDVALAAWWTSVAYLAGVRAPRRGVLAQGFDPLHYPPEALADRLAATASLAAGYDVVAVSDWVAAMVRAVRPAARCTVVRPGIDKAVFGGAPRAGGDGPLRVLVEGQPSLWFKGIEEALAAARGMARAPHVTLATLEPLEGRPPGVDRVLSGLDAPGMARLYRECDVVLKLSRFEGLGLGPLEAFHAGVPCVVTPYGGHAEYVQHNHNGLVVGFDDEPATTRALDRLDEDRALLERLSEGAERTAGAWPDAGTGTAGLAAALEAMRPGPGDPALEQAVTAHVPALRNELDRLRHELSVRDRRVEHELGRIRELDADRASLSARLAEAIARGEALNDELVEVRSSRAYRAATGLRSLVRRGR